MRRAFLILLAASLAAACGGGGDIALGPSDGGVGSGGTGAVAVVASGAVEGFGSIIVNGTRYDTDSARFELRDTQALRLGMTVQVTGTVSADLSTGTATLVTSAAQLRGAVAGLDRAAGSFQIAGVRVGTDASTVFSAAEGVAGLGDGAQVQVWGLLRDGALLATRIEPLASAAAAAEQVVTDTVQQLDPVAGSFRLGDLQVQYAAGALQGAWAGGGITAGQSARVSGTLTAAGTLEASRIEPATPTPTTESTALSISGNVAQWDGRRFRLNGYTVDASTARVTGPGTLRDGARVDVLGTLRQGVLQASWVRLKQGNSSSGSAGSGASGTGSSDAGNGNTGSSSGSGSTGNGSPLPVLTTFSASGPIGMLRAGPRFSVHGQAVDASSAQVRYVNGSEADVRPGRKVLVTGTRVLADVLIAERIEFSD